VPLYAAKDDVVDGEYIFVFHRNVTKEVGKLSGGSQWGRVDSIKIYWRLSVTYRKEINNVYFQG
jgi:hypothetical protein